MKQLAKRLVSLLAQIGADPSDEEDLRLKKSLLVLASALFLLAGFCWGFMYFLFGAWLAGAIPIGYGVISLLSVGLFGATRRYRVFRFSQLSLILLLPFLLMLALGGFYYGSAVILWSLVGPTGAMLFDEPRNAPKWFAGFAVMVAVAGVLEPWVAVTNPLPSQVITFFFVVNLLGVGSLIFLLVRYFIGEKDAFQDRSERLLLNILPKEIARRLRSGPSTIADQFPGASVLFADVVNFTPLSATMSPGELVNLLDEVFSYLDSLTEKYGLEKIKTIGDCYMVASGIPKPRADHAQALTRMALEMTRYVGEHDFRGRKLIFRIGLNSGPVVAGVIGRKKFTHDLWGDVVNTASRMESHGEPGRVQVTRATYDIIRNEFVCQPRGIIEVKGLGSTEAWFVVGPLTGDAVHKPLR